MRYFLLGLLIVILIRIFIGFIRKPGSKIFDAIRDGDHEKLQRILKRIDPKKLGRMRGNDFFCRIMEMENLTPLQYACYAGDRETVRMLVEAGANVNTPYRSYAWGNPLWYVNNRRHDRDRFLIGMDLVDAGAECTSTENVLKEILILSADESKDEELCRQQLDYFRKVYELQKAAADKPMTDSCPSLLYLGAGSRNTLIVDLLLEEVYPLNPEADAKSGRAAGSTPLGRAAEHGDVRMVEYLLSLGADPELRDVAGKTPFEAVRVQKKQVETQDIYKSEREHLGDYDRVIEILAER